VSRPLPVPLLLVALAGCAERCPGAPPQPVFGGGSGVECRLLAFEDGRPTLACFKRCPPREPVDVDQGAARACRRCGVMASRPLAGPSGSRRRAGHPAAPPAAGESLPPPGTAVLVRGGR